VWRRRVEQTKETARCWPASHACEDPSLEEEQERPDKREEKQTNKQTQQQREDVKYLSSAFPLVSKAARLLQGLVAPVGIAGLNRDRVHRQRHARRRRGLSRRHKGRSRDGRTRRGDQVGRRKSSSHCGRHSWRSLHVQIVAVLAVEALSRGGEVATASGTIKKGTKTKKRETEKRSKHTSYRASWRRAEEETPERQLYCFPILQFLQ
jgi:hypothetical protein